MGKGVRLSLQVRVVAPADAHMARKEGDATSCWLRPTPPPPLVPRPAGLACCFLLSFCRRQEGALLGRGRAARKVSAHSA